MAIPFFITHLFLLFKRKFDANFQKRKSRNICGLRVNKVINCYNSNSQLTRSSMNQCPSSSNRYMMLRFHSAYSSVPEGKSWLDLLFSLGWRFVSYYDTNQKRHNNLCGQSINDGWSAKNGKIKAARGLPNRIKVDNGPKFFSRVLDAWAYFNKVNLDYSRPGTPTDHPYIESFNDSFRDECLNMNWFMSLEDARDKVEGWRRDYNEFRLYSAVSITTVD